MEDVLSGNKPRSRHEPPSAAVRPQATVLLVDHRSYDRRAIADALAAQRIAAPTLPNADRALAALGRPDEPIDALLCSTAMPGCVDLVRRAEALRPALCFLLVARDPDHTSAALEHLDRIGRPCHVVWPDVDAPGLAREATALLRARSRRAAA